MSDTIKTVLHTYDFDLRKPEQKAAWEALRDNLATWPHKMESWGGASHYYFVARLDGKEIELETRHLFDNQWNTGPVEGSDKGLRVFDWALDAQVGPVPSWCRRGHYLDQTAEMREVRRNTLKCPYCGHQEAAAKGSVFCPECMDSAYLTESDLRKGATRLRAIDESGTGADWIPLTDAEAAHLVPLYTQAQLHGTTERGKARLAKALRDIEASAAKATSDAKTERDGMIWLLDRMPGVLENAIFYKHTGRFGFGWRQPMGTTQTGALLEIISEFPFPYDITTAKDSTYQGRTLSGG